MPVTFRQRSLALVLLVAAGTHLTACGVAEEAKKKMDELAAMHVGSFDDVTRTPVVDAADGRTFLLRGVARREVQWYDAWSAFFDLPGGHCADGEPFTLLRISPAVDQESLRADMSAHYPAGTVFEQQIRCADPFGGQRVLAADADPVAEMKAMRLELAGDGDFDRNRHLVSVATFNDRSPKYESVTRMIGGMVMSTQRRCRDAGVNVQRILVHSKPTPHPSERVFLNRSEALVGLDVVCGDGLPVDDES